MLPTGMQWRICLTIADKTGMVTAQRLAPKSVNLSVPSVKTNMTLKLLKMKRQCSKCKENKLLEAFYLRGANSRARSHCKDCHRSYRTKTRDRQRQNRAD